MKTSQRRARKSLAIIILSILILTILGSCNKIQNIAGPVSTWTPLPSATPTCPLDIGLSTPVGWSTSTRMIVILYKPQSLGAQNLQLKDGGTAQDIPSFVKRIIPKIMEPGDQTSVFQLGYKRYEDARVTRLYSYISRPQLYDTPSLNKILPTVVKLVGTPQPGLVGVATANGYKAQETAAAAVATANKIEYDCRINLWNGNAQFTATAWDPIQNTELGNISGTATADFGNFEQNLFGKKPSYSGWELYDGLVNATIDLKTDCSEYNQCVLVVVDDLLPWINNPPSNLQIDLSEISNIYVIMPNCKDINQPSCTMFQDYWNKEFKNYGFNATPVYWNANRVEENLLTAFGR